VNPLKTDSVLDAIVAGKVAELEGELRREPLESVRAAAELAPPARDFAAALRTRPVGIVAEIKRRSPSRGVLADSVDPPELARRYQAAGADAISVLTEQHHFNGSLADLRAVRAAVEIPLLRKDFLFAPYHLYQARAAGADAALLIVAMLEDAALRDLIALADEIGLAALVEVHAEREVERALAGGARLVGINNRDLHSFAVDLAVTERLRPLVPTDLTVVGESGVHGAAEVDRLRAAGVQAILVGEALMRAGLDGVPTKLAELRGAP
jgi:indole-3-glycerol phosphate synthase